MRETRREGDRDVTRDRFSVKKLPEKVDVVVVGSGIGGLYLAALLAKSGRVVLVLEQSLGGKALKSFRQKAGHDVSWRHYVAGGCTHEFTDKGWTFDTGIHYIGRVEKYGKLLDLVSDEHIEFARLETCWTSKLWQRLGTASDGYVYDQIKIGDELHPLRAGRQNFIEASPFHYISFKVFVEPYWNGLKDASGLTEALPRGERSHQEICRPGGEASELTHPLQKLLPGATNQQISISSGSYSHASSRRS